MEQVGKVIKTDDGFATVQVQRTTACGEKCSSCKGCHATNKTSFVNNEIGASVGEIVKFELNDFKIILAAFVVYIVPLIALIVGYVAFGVIYGFAFFAIPFAILKVLDNKLSPHYIGKITKIIDHI